MKILIGTGAVGAIVLCLLLTSSAEAQTGVEERLEALELTLVERALEEAKKIKVGVWTEFVLEDVLNLPTKPSITFDIRNLNIFLDAPIAERFRFYAELELRGESITQTGRAIGIQDDMAFNLERAWIDWNHNEQINLRFGKFLTPYGIWNLDHFATKRVTTRDPFLIRREIIPETLTGARFYGAVSPVDVLVINYTGWIGNGKGTNPDTQDVDVNKAVGGRVGLTVSLLGELTVGGTIHSGQSDYSSVAGPIITPASATLTLDEMIYGLDVEYRLGPIRYLFEYVSADLENSTGLKFDDRSWYNQLEFAFIGLRDVGLDLEELGVGFLNRFVAFVRHDYNQRDSKEIRPPLMIGIFDQNGYVVTTGLNFHPRDNIVVKGEFHWHRLKDGGPAHQMVAFALAMVY